MFKKVEYRHLESIQQFTEIHVDFCNYKWFLGYEIYSRSSMYRRLQMNSSYIIAKFNMECDRVLRVALFIHEIHSNPTSSK